MYCNVVVGIDGHHGGQDAAALAAALADDDAALTLVTVTVSDHVTGDQHDPFADPRPAAWPPGPRRAPRADAHRVDIAAVSVGAGLEAVALQRRADLIVVGTSRRHGIIAMLTDDDACSLMHQTPCAVAVAPTHYARDPQPLARIGVAYHDSPESDVALAHAGLLAAQRGAHLRLCHVIDPHAAAPDTTIALIAPSDHHTPLHLPRGQSPLGDRLTIERAYGPVPDELVAFGDQVDLLVCGSRRNGPLRRISFSTTSTHLARHLHTPLIVAPAIDTTSVEHWQRITANPTTHHQTRWPSSTPARTPVGAWR